MSHPSPLESTVLVVGAGLAGLRVVERLRAAGHTGRIVVVGEEEHAPYNRPPLSKEVLRGAMDADRLPFRQKAAASENVEWRLGTRVEVVDHDARAARLDDGSEVAYDGLVVATGVRARRLDLPGDARWRHSVRTLEDAQRLAPELRQGTRVAIVGGGFIGCEVAATATTLGCEVTVIEPLAAPLARPLGEVLAREVQRRHETHGVRFALGRSVAGVEDGGEHLEVLLDNGARVPTDVIVEAVGSQANVEALTQMGLDLGNGVLCDRDLHPLRDGVPLLDAVVVGDVARFPIAGYGEDPVRVEHWTMPTDMGAHAAASLLAGLAGEAPDPATPFAPLPTFWSEQYGVRMQAFGLPHLGHGDVRVLDGDLTSEAAVGFHDPSGALVGVVLVGMGKRMLEFRTAVAEARAAQVLEPTG
ncbi:FAD-dependent oxidoreductase [Nocardioides zeae]|uniref:FAD-dependent oxidoreductase n=1 Tax=Nocardioides imazamoxiresistens TaxID=3231893 RepID=A0ABU3PSE5_9ACTN|nr:FAD-dependent oxidoreductase [Nocardioides zeae]MDT9591705.1 FAD-dependent oxidoreductase [Nocardioides zeae]